MSSYGKGKQGGMLRAYHPDQHDKWLHGLKMRLRKDSRFAEQAINGEHTRPDGAADALRAGRESGGFNIDRLSQSNLLCLSEGESSADSSHTDEEQAPRIEELDQSDLEEAILSTLQSLMVEADAGRESRMPEGGEEHKEVPPPQAPVTREAGVQDATPEAEAAASRATPLGDQTTISIGAGMATPARAAPATPSPLTRAGGESVGEGTLRTFPEQDISFAEDPSRRETLGSRMSTLMRGLRSGLRTTAGNQQETKQDMQQVGAAPRPEGETLTFSQKAPRPDGASDGTINPMNLQQALHATVIAWQQRREARNRRNRSRRGTRKRKGKRKVDTGKSFVKRRKLVAALSEDGMSTAAYLRLPEEIRIAVWEHSSEILYQLIAQSLGHKYRHWIGRVATGDGYGCYEAMLLRDNECTSGAKNAFLTELMGLEMRMT